MIYVFAFFSIFGAVTFWLLYGTSNRFHVMVRKAFGAKVIHIKGMNSAIASERWKAILETDAFGEIYAYRYPECKIGIVNLKKDGTGHYCGSVVWKLDQ